MRIYYHLSESVQLLSLIIASSCGLETKMKYSDFQQHTVRELVAKMIFLITRITSQNIINEDEYLLRLLNYSQLYLSELLAADFCYHIVKCPVRKKLYKKINQQRNTVDKHQKGDGLDNLRTRKPFAKHFVLLENK